MSSRPPTGDAPVSEDGEERGSGEGMLATIIADLESSASVSAQMAVKYPPESERWAEMVADANTFQRQAEFLRALASRIETMERADCPKCGTALECWSCGDSVRALSASQEGR